MYPDTGVSIGKPIYFLSWGCVTSGPWATPACPVWHSHYGLETVGVPCASCIYKCFQASQHLVYWWKVSGTFHSCKVVP